MLAAIGSFGYNLMLFVHIVTVIVAFAPAVIHPVLEAQLRSDASARSRVFGFLAGNSRRIHAPALLLSGVVGMGLVGMSDKAFRMSQAWTAGAFVLWIAMNGVLHAVVIPAERALAARDESARQRLTVGDAALNVMLVVMLVLMIWKPGA